ncbi:DUF6248 family natural product biosynthesis protein [Micromonospora tulbaghiae]|uniref:DUF6248 family natural product biosynthesis protein n=1 Tax=Micromonospora tulbaghiae TaxID=479978 RepID=UPI00344554D0
MNVLPDSYRRNTVDPARCACQYGTCGYCRANRHPDCHTAAWGSSPSPETYLCGPGGTALAPVWRSGTPCRWVCSCTCRSTPAPVEPVQLDLFDLAAA